MDNNKSEPISYIIVSLMIVGLIVLGYLYIMNWSDYNSFKDRTDRCKICAEQQNLICSNEHSIPSLYEYVNNIHTDYLNCLNDEHVSNCIMCYPDLPV